LQCAQGAGWRVVASFEGVLPKRIKGLPLDSMFELSSVKKVSSLVLLKVVLAVFAS
jgi:dynamin GTPase